MRIGVDAGGTFTDFVVLHDDGRLDTFKLRSNPHSPAKVILAGLEQAAQGKQKVDVVHGSTVATNALLERKGARTAFVTTAGFEDLLEIGRQNRPELYNLTPQPRRPLIPRDLCFGVHERVYHDGTVARRPTAAELRRLVARIKRVGVRSVAICFLHAYQNSVNERAVLAALNKTGLYVCASHDVSPEFREYERSSTTAVNAYVGPLMEAYLAELERARRFQIAIMQSNGGFLSANEARRHAVRTVLSGPAGGVVGAMKTARRGGFRKILGFDMGGTSTDVSLADGVARETTEASIDGFPIRVPMLDIHTVGAGGGSIARVDAGGLLRVGPESAGADPGPACYGSGTEPTVTDAHVVLGRIHSLLGGGMRVDADRAAAAVDRIARRLKLDRSAAAAGILRVANSNMERAIRVVSVERGYDPREFALVAFGGCGGLHACEIAGQLGIRSVIVPQHAGALSALGMLMADALRDYAAGVLGHGNLENTFEALEKRARSESPKARIERSADLRYRGQSYELNVPWTSPTRAAVAFHNEHARIYGYSLPERDVEVVTIRVRARAASPKPKLVRSAIQEGATETRLIWVSGSWRRIPVWNREQLAQMPRRGPALVLDYGSTTLVPADWRFHVDSAGNVLIQH
ncbi:MAG: hydantoinase/oxoprolinase family protein [Acidobacteriia bacterium]|nr:hydantoinase/oxoprolinase family protein [Terriglobia bacterium]